jgi:microcystin-dependent protein
MIVRRRPQFTRNTRPRQITAITSDITKSEPIVLSVPIGTVLPFANNVAPFGYLICDGTAISRTQYAYLYGVIGTKYGVGDGNDTFNLPDFRAKFPIGYNSDKPLGTSGGSFLKTITVNNLPAHSHTGTTDSNGVHSHTYTRQQVPQNIAAAEGGTTTAANETTFQADTDTAGAHTHTFTSNNTGGGQQLDVTNPYITVTYIIRYRF